MKSQFCICLMIKDIEHFLNCFIQPFGFPFLRILCLEMYYILNSIIWGFFVSGFKNYLYILDISPLTNGYGW